MILALEVCSTTNGMDVSLLIGGHDDVGWKSRDGRGFAHFNGIDRAKVALLTDHLRPPLKTFSAQALAR